MRAHVVVGVRCDFIKTNCHGRAPPALLRPWPRTQQPRLCPKSSGGLIKEVSLEKWGWKTIVSQFNCGGKSLVGSAALANFLDHAHNYNVVDEFTTTSLPTV